MCTIVMYYNREIAIGIYVPWWHVRYNVYYILLCINVVYMLFSNSKSGVFCSWNLLFRFELAFIDS